MKDSWGGKWTKQKLDAFEAYVKAYLKIMHGTRKKCKGWPKEIIYFDGFAGSGSQCNALDETTNNQACIDFGIKIEEQNVYQGSAERVLRLEKKFDRYIFVDNDNNAIHSLKLYLKRKELNTNKCEFFEGDVNQQLSKFLDAWNKENTALIFLDPFGMQVYWETISKMKEKRIDLWILVPSGVIINRLLDGDGKLIHLKSLQRYLGMRENQMRSTFYEMETVTTLFGNEVKIEKKKDPIHLIAKSYITQLSKIFKYFTKKPLELKNSRNVTIFHFIFASNNKTAVNIANQIIEKKAK